ncbi:MULTISPECIES: ECF transporter S component [unclassified Pseudoclavibacter]|uniref:ECF transporter S component n=1 Tax=unclassified Pseudoclavibacter TaxID=2615177 RepID=UPI001BA9BBB4|nr:ECF transporter S component [Pseudoclavibacter sp. Marseille-Q4354]MBS3179669.1 ECF transporter S component [Pseudoclavibacter sp. Marseille-Q4354]
MTTSSTPSHNSPAQGPAQARSPKSRFRWRVIDIVTAAVLGVATGLIFIVWNSVGYAWFTVMDAFTPGVGGIAVGIWLLGGVLGGLIIRKPGAALFVEVLAASVSMLLGSQWSIETVYSGIAQGLGAELIFLLFFYKRFGLGVAMLAGAGAAVAAWTLELFLSANIEKGPEFLTIYLVSVVLSGAVLAGVVGWLLTRALAATGALNRFAAGRSSKRIG